MESKEKFYQKWWFWVIIAVIILIIIEISFESFRGKETSANVVNKNNSTETLFSNSKKDYYDNKRINENPYEITNIYDGIYKFKLQRNNEESAIGVITLNKGECKVKYFKSINAQYSIEYSGFCGLNQKDDSTFYFTVNDDENYEVKTYQCVLDGKNLYCKLKSKYDVTGNLNNELLLIYIGESNDLSTTLYQVLNEEKTKIEQETKLKEEQEKQTFISSCQTYTFEQMARNPNNFKGTNVKVTGEVVQALYGSSSVDLRINITKKGTYSPYYTDTITQIKIFYYWLSFSLSYNNLITSLKTFSFACSIVIPFAFLNS